MHNFMEHSIHVSKLDLAICVTQQNSKPNHVKRRQHGLVYQYTGSVSYHFSDGKTLVLKPGHILYLPMGATYEVKPIIEARTSYAINFLVVEPIEQTPFIVSAPKSTQLYELFRECRDIWETSNPWKYERCVSLLYAIIAGMKKEYFKAYAPSSKTKLIQPAIRYIEQNYLTENIKITFLAELCKISDVHFRNVFYSVYNMSPHKYIHNLRILRAKELLRSGEYTVQAVAELCGFGSDCAFSRDFKQATGITPSDYKNQF